MATTTQPWLEDLSEEWVQQPSPNASAIDVESMDKQEDAQKHLQKARSRLPRMRHSSTSFSEINVRSIAPELRPPKQRSALAERNSNSDNIPHASSLRMSKSASIRDASYTASDESQSSLMYNGTVAHNTVAKSPVKEAGQQDTPEWRRRLVNGEVGYGDQKDLFGPSGLENIFQRPSSAGTKDIQQPKTRLGLSKDFPMPSSPPAWPTSVINDASQVQQEEQVEYEQGSTVIQKQMSELTDRSQAREESFSALSMQRASQGIPRTVSGQIEFENESFSPVYLTTNLKIGQTPSQPSAFRGSELANRLRQIGSPPPSHATPVAEDHSLASREDSSLARLQDESFPEGLPAGTPDYADVGRFVELRRGGYSRDGSFRRRPLSPSPGKKSAPSSTLREEIEDAAENTDGQSAADRGNTSPKTPRRNGQSQFLSPERATTSGSPLKLFDAHDTYTSNRLQRRLSQLENKSEKTTSSSKTEHAVGTTSTVSKTTKLTSVDEASFQRADLADEHEEVSQVSCRVGTFGQGQMNEYQFPADLSTLSSDFLDAQDDSAPEGSPSIDVAPPGSRSPFKFHLDQSPASRTASSSRRVSSGSRVYNSLRTASRPKFEQHRKPSFAPEQDQSEGLREYSDGKRGPTSPFKNPTPKRRRTIHSFDGEDIENDGEVFSDTAPAAAQQSSVRTSSLIGRKRKDARPDFSHNIADAETLARRHILRPRNPTPSQRRRDEIEAEIMEATDAFILSSPKLNTIREQLESSEVSDSQLEQARATAVASEVAAYSMRKQNGMRNEARKKSVTTQDFLDEAVKIMNYIRTKGQSASGLGSLEETEAESEFQEDLLEHPSSSLTFERPPSREGRASSWKEPNQQHALHPDVADHLRKFQEGDNDTFLNSSVNSIRFPRIKSVPSPGDESIIIEQDDIRITDNPHRPSRVQDDGISSQTRTTSTHQSTGSSVGQTVVTNTSRRSDHVATLAPEAVAHLIPQEIAGMSFDREKGIWVRQKSPSKEHRHRESDTSDLNESEEDPFGNIPDLTVEESKTKSPAPVLPQRPQPTSETILEDSEDRESEEEKRPVTREGQGIAFTDASSVPSKVSNFGWSYPKTETRATSWSTQAPRNSTMKAAHVQTTSVIPESEEDDIEHEIRYFEGRGHATPAVQRTRVRDITISFADHQGPEIKNVTADVHRSSHHWASAQVQRQSHKKQVLKERAQKASTLPTARTGGFPLFTGDGDLSLLDEVPQRNYQMQVSMNLTAPVLDPTDADARLAVPSSPMKGDVTFMLSELPEFTLNQVDERELPERMIVKHDGHRFSKALEDRYAQGTANLVKAMQDVEPDEPYWEDLRKIDLHGKDLSTLHRLDELCFQLEELDVSDNKIGQTNGIPGSMRRLWAQNNSLSALASWDTLLNLQHLDVSGNDLDSLDPFGSLIHLRVLKVDKNKIRSLNGILHLDGLMELSVGENEITTIDFANTDLKSLTDLDLRKNRLLEVRNLHKLPSLQHINLDDNDIEEFPLFDTPTQPCKSLRSLRLCRNGTSLLDVDRHFPKLESLYVDGNSLTQVSGLEHLRYLRTFSAREQSLSTDADTETCIDNLLRNAEVRNLYMSLNCTHTLDISHHLLSLQRLELASMGLKTLPEGFGQMTPNIRSINLNFNSIRDIRPLLNIKRLDELLLAGNKLERLRASSMVLGKLETLSKLDWRENPLTQRFYAPTSENRIMSLRKKPADEQLTDRFTLPEADADEDIQFVSRLDYETRVRRRVTEMMLANLCKNLRTLDGLPFDKARVLVKDDVWERLLLLGVISRKQPGQGDISS